MILDAFRSMYARFMAYALVRSVLTPTTGVPEDKVVNSWVLEYTQLGSPQTLATAWERFWGEGAGVGSPGPQAYLSPLIQRAIGASNGPRLEVRALNVATGEVSADPEVIPFDLSQFPPVTGTVPLPNEVAACISFRAPGTPLGRRRGRMFIGPLNSGAISDGTGVARLTPGLRQGLAEGFKRMADFLFPQGAYPCVWSRADGEAYRITEAWADDAFDTQRRRGVKPLSRTTLPIP